MRLAEGERDPRVKLGWGRSLTAEQQALGLKMAELWIGGVTMAEIGAEFGFTAAGVRARLIRFGVYDWAVRERRRNAEQIIEVHRRRMRPAPPPKPHRPPIPETVPRRVRPKYGWRAGLREDELTRAEAEEAEANRAWIADRRTEEAECPVCEASGTDVCRTPTGRPADRWHKARTEALGDT